MKKGTWINIIIILAILVLAILILTLNNSSHPDTDEETVKCIGDNSILYVQLGCHHCETQERMFGNYTEYLTIIDCFYENEKCDGVQGTPSWKINGVMYMGVQSIEKLINLTGC